MNRKFKDAYRKVLSNKRDILENNLSFLNTGNFKHKQLNENLWRILKPFTKKKPGATRFFGDSHPFLFNNVNDIERYAHSPNFGRRARGLVGPDFDNLMDRLNTQMGFIGDKYTKVVDCQWYGANTPFIKIRTINPQTGEFTDQIYYLDEIPGNPIQYEWKPVDPNAIGPNWQLGDDMPEEAFDNPSGAIDKNVKPIPLRTPQFMPGIGGLVGGAAAGEEFINPEEQVTDQPQSTPVEYRPDGRYAPRNQG